MKSNFNKKWYTRWWAITIYILVGLIAVFLFILLSRSDTPYQRLVTNLKQGNKELTQKEKEALLDESNPRLGSENADITIVEFFSFNCPGAQSMHSTIREIGINYADNVKIIHRDLPTTQNAIQYSLAARCAGEQGKFWSMYDRLFQQEDLKLNKIDSLAQRINIDMEQFRKCFENGKYVEDIKEDMRDGETLGVQGSPTTFINGYKIERPIPRDIFMSIIEEMLK